MQNKYVTMTMRMGITVGVTMYAMIPCLCITHYLPCDGMEVTN